MEVLFACLVGVVGLFVGSFLNVCIYRLPLKEEVVKTPSHCPECGENLKWYHLVPLFSWIFLGGKCAFCKSKISAQYPLVELLNGVLWALIFWRYSFIVSGVFSFYGLISYILLSVVVSTLIIVSFIDAKTLHIPNSLNLIIFICAILLLVLKTYFATSIGVIYTNVAALIFIGGAFFAIASLVENGMGGGDVKLIAACSLLMGISHTLLAIIIGFFIASVVGITRIIINKSNRKTLIPLGPYISFGVIVSLLYGNIIINYYLSLFV
ncbi:MAG: prepilin peptidase [Clostridiales bacterium]|nr:prepilin peptidase [Clostridiales bacterium]